MNRITTTKLAASVFVLGLASPAWAQSGTAIPVPGTPYVKFVEELDDVGGYQEIANPNNEFTIPAASSPFSQCADISMPYDFDFYGDSVSTVSACSHGAINMAPGPTLSTNNWVPGGAPQFGNDTDGFIAPFWGIVYLNGSTDASFGWEIAGNAPTRYLAMEYLNATDASSTFNCCRWELDMQVRLYEGLSGKIEIDYNLEDTGSASGGNATATAGMENLQGGQPIDFINQSTPSDFWNWSDVQRELDGKRITFVQDPGIELAALAAVAPEFAPLGAEYDIDVTVANLNVNTLGPFAVSVEVSESINFPDDETTDIGQSFTLTLPQYQTRTVPVPALAPVALGERRYFHRVCVDSADSIGEVNEDNNCVVTEIQTRYLPSRPDVTVDRVRIPVRSAQPEQLLPVTITVSNIGSEPVTDLPVAVMLSGNPAISPQDSELGRTLVSLPAGTTEDLTVDVPLPAVINSGAYFLGAYADIDDEVVESNEANNGRAVIFELAVEGGDVEIITSRIPNPLVGETYSAQFTAVGGDGNYSWSVVGRPANDLPNPGLSLETGEGLVFGVCQAEGPQDFTIRVASSGDSAERAYTLDCVDPEEPLTVVTRSVPDGITGQEYTFGLIVTGGASAQPENLSWSASNLPLGIDITETGVLAGTPVEAGTQVATITVTDGNETDEQQLTINIRNNQNLLIEVAQLPTAFLGEPYQAKIEASGGVGEPIFTDERGGLDGTGLVLDPDGTITGIPERVGPIEFTVRAQDQPATGLRAVDQNRFVINVVDDSQAFRIATDSLPPAVRDEAYNFAIAAVGGVPALIWDVEGTLPTGLEVLDDTEGSQELIIDGTPEATDPGRFIVVTVTDALGRQAQKVLVLAVVEPGQDVPTCPDPTDERCPDPGLAQDDGGCTAVAGGTSSGFVGLMLALGAMLVARRRRR